MYLFSLLTSTVYFAAVYFFPLVFSREQQLCDMVPPVRKPAVKNARDRPCAGELEDIGSQAIAFEPLNISGKAFSPGRTVPSGRTSCIACMQTASSMEGNRSLISVDWQLSISKAPVCSRS